MLSTQVSDAQAIIAYSSYLALFLVSLGIGAYLFGKRSKGLSK